MNRWLAMVALALLVLAAAVGAHAWVEWNTPVFSASPVVAFPGVLCVRGHSYTVTLDLDAKALTRSVQID